MPIEDPVKRSRPIKSSSLSLSARGVYYKVLVAYCLMSLLPILITLYLSFNYVLPKIPDEERFSFTDPVVQAMIWTIVLVPLLGFFIVITIAKRVEQLAKAIRTMEVKPQAQAEAAPESPAESEDEIEVLAKQFHEMRRMITAQISQLDDLKSKLDDSNVRVLEANRQLKELSIRDSLTNLFNRRYFDGRLDEEMQRARRYGRKFALEMVDIDHFKDLNDKHGHTCGDEILKQVARIMTEVTRDSDVVCRYGGEEFSILLIEVDEASAYNHAERLRQTVAACSFSNGQGPVNEQVTVSVGVAFFPQDATDPRVLVECADGALYAAKRGGRNQVKRASDLQKQENRVS